VGDSLGRSNVKEHVLQLIIDLILDNRLDEGSDCKIGNFGLILTDLLLFTGVVAIICKSIGVEFNFFGHYYLRVVFELILESETMQNVPGQ
jgi:hypothetical protein